MQFRLHSAFCCRQETLIGSGSENRISSVCPQFRKFPAEPRHEKRAGKRPRIFSVPGSQTSFCQTYIPTFQYNLVVSWISGTDRFSIFKFFELNFLSISVFGNFRYLQPNWNPIFYGTDFLEHESGPRKML